MSNLTRWMATAAVLILLSASPALAHTGVGTIGGFVSGFTHPLFGPDHLVAMVAVGLWGAILGPPLIWLLPVTFPLVMAFGGLLGVLGVPLPAVEIGIALSGIVLGLVVATAFRPVSILAVLIIAVFAVLHGHAHGAELPEAANPLAYSIGFVLATGLLHLCGILIGLLIKTLPGTGMVIVRACGVVVALVGFYFLGGSLGLI